MGHVLLSVEVVHGRPWDYPELLHPSMHGIALELVHGRHHQSFLYWVDYRTWHVYLFFGYYILAGIATMVLGCMASAATNSGLAGIIIGGGGMFGIFARAVFVAMVPMHAVIILDFLSGLMVFGTLVSALFVLLAAIATLQH